MISPAYKMFFSEYVFSRKCCLLANTPSFIAKDDLLVQFLCIIEFGKGVHRNPYLNNAKKKLRLYTLVNYYVLFYENSFLYSTFLLIRIKYVLRIKALVSRYRFFLYIFHQLIK